MSRSTSQNPAPWVVPADVPEDRVTLFNENFSEITGSTGRLMLFAGDQKAEHLNQDFHGEGISREDASPEHLFQIAAAARIGVFATQLGLIARYGRFYPGVPYLVKLNSKTNLVPFTQRDPLSLAWHSVSDVMSFKHSSGLKIAAVGYTIYPGSEYESEMLGQAAKIIHEAHRQGLVTVIWGYPKGRAVTDEHDLGLVAGAAGLAACLGADFVKLKVPLKDGVMDTAGLASEVVSAAGNTGVLMEGGTKESPRAFLTQLHAQIHEGGCRGSGTGRNIHQRALPQAIALANAIRAVTIENQSVDEALRGVEAAEGTR
jgi:class I fructose-bisphosphate aldolase/fructose-bisphosphate aldolase/6-deoxy-5-ketofructose 1-phosphate synthase